MSSTRTTTKKEPSTRPDKFSSENTRIDASGLAEQLAAPFPAADVEWRVQQAGSKNGRVWARVLPYVTNRAIMDRLDHVVGPENWQNTFSAGPNGGVLSGIAIRIGEEWVTKYDGAENTDIESVKGGLSGAMKRAAVQWGIGRYLYRLEEGWAEVHAGGKHFGRTKEGEAFRWDPPELPAWALTEAERGANGNGTRRAGNGGRNARRKEADGDRPQSSDALTEQLQASLAAVGTKKSAGGKRTAAGPGLAALRNGGRV